jgi:putative flippase GtrA
MIPKHMKRQAKIMTFISLGLLLTGVIMGVTWVLLNMPK